MNNLERWWFFPLFFFEFTAISYTVILHELHVKAFGSFMWIGNESRIIELFYEDKFTMSCQQQRCFHRFAHKHTHKFGSTKGHQALQSLVRRLDDRVLTNFVVDTEKDCNKSRKAIALERQNAVDADSKHRFFPANGRHYFNNHWFYSSSVLMFNTLGYIIQNIPK